jgi:class 3 adenylate cyclase/tetratricopeptide (TPR) repeat protein
MHAHLAAYLPPDLVAEVTREGARMGLLLDALNRLLSIRYLLGTHLPQSLVGEVERDPTPGTTRERELHGTLLYADVSGFTALSERLAAEEQDGLERLTAHINAYFERVVEVVVHSGGELMKFAGDALLARFPALEGDRQAGWAVRAGHRMLRALEAHPSDGVPLRMKVGVATGDFWVASVGSARRMEYVILGDAVARTLAAEKAARAGQVVVDAATAAALPPAQQTPHPEAPGFHATVVDEGALGEFEIRPRGRRRPRSTASWMSGRDEVLEELRTTLRQVETLAAYLPSAIAKRIVSSADARRLPGENRPAAVLFVHLAGLETARRLSDYFKAVHEIVSRYGGIVSRVDPYARGSKFLILFGAPVAHEDDPQRALRAALEIDAALPRLHRLWERLPHPPDATHAFGLTYGPTFAGQVGTSTHREYTVMGDDVNLAARLMARAEGGQILTSRAVRAAAEGHALFSPLPPMEVRGKERPVPVWQVEGLRDDRLARRLEGRRPLVGREGEWQRAVALLDEALQGRGRHLVVRGGAGVGKSHFADALVTRALEGGARISLTASAAYQTATAYAPWTALLQAAAGVESRDGAETRREKLAALLQPLDPSGRAPILHLLGLRRNDDALGPLRKETAQDGAGQQGTGATPNLFDKLSRASSGAEAKGPSLWELTRQRREGTTEEGNWQRLQTRVTTRQRERLFAALSALLRALTDRAPLVLLFEDAQWMDEPSRNLLNFIAKELDDRPALLLEVERSLEPEGQDVLFLEPLSPSGTAALIAGALGDAPTPTPLPQLAQAVHRLTQGNPLFTEEIVRWLQRTNWAQVDRLSAGLRSSHMLQELVISRLDNLSADAREVVRAASVVGDPFTAEELGILLDAPAQAVGKALASLEEKSWVLPSEVGEKEGYAFRQSLVGEMVYDSLPRTRRRALHELLTAHLKEREGKVEKLAHHMAQAGDTGAAAEELLRAAVVAREEKAYDRAAAYYEGALEYAEAEETGARAREGGGDVALLTGDLGRAAAAYRSVDEVKVTPRLLTKKAVVHYKQAELRYRQGDVEGARGELERSKSLVEGTGKAAAGVVEAVRRALALVDEGRREPWAEQAWQRRDDAYYVTLLPPSES